MGKHLKRLRAEKAKIKLKKKLPKGQNITDTAFQVKKIVISEQLPDRVGIVLTSKRQTLQDCLNYLNHHNVQKQLDGLRGIKELFIANAVKALEVRQIVARLLDAGVEDRESKIRRGAIKLLSEMFSLLPIEVKSSFSELVTKQLQRGLSNINPGIQNDALRLVDILLMLTLDISGSWQTIVELLLRLLTMTGSSAPPRLEVLRRLYSVCSSALQVTQKTKNTQKTDNSKPLTSIYKTMAAIPMTAVTIQQNTNIKNLIGRIMRIGIGIWTEIAPDRQVNSGKLEVVLLLTRLPLLLYRYLSEQENGKELTKWFVDSFQQLIGQNLLKKFPFQLSTPGTMPEDSSRLLEVNTNLAALFMYLKAKFNHKAAICNFIRKPLKTRPVSSTLIALLEMLIMEKNERQAVVRQIAVSASSSPDEKLNKLLQKIALDVQFATIHQLAEFKEWLGHLVTNPHYANTLTKIASHGVNDELISSVAKNRELILMNEPINRDFLNILYWTCPHDELAALANDVKYCSSVRNYLKSILYPLA